MPRQGSANQDPQPANPTSTSAHRDQLSVLLLLLYHRFLCSCCPEPHIWADTTYPAELNSLPGLLQKLCASPRSGWYLTHLRDGKAGISQPSCTQCSSRVPRKWHYELPPNAVSLKLLHCSKIQCLKQYFPSWASLVPLSPLSCIRDPLYIS